MRLSKKAMRLPKKAMRLSQKGELSLLREIKKRFHARVPAVKVGIGDDAAVLAFRDSLVATTDMMMEGVHFDLDYITAQQLGFKLISVNVSDIYAMAGRPLFTLLNMALRSEMTESFVWEFLSGVNDACRLYGVSLIGGDLSSTPDRVALSATLLGSVKKPVTRAGALPGHKIFVTGTLGDSAAGLLLLKKLRQHIDFKKPPKGPLPWKAIKPLLKRHLMPVARKPKALNASSMIDISDGLLIDLARLCEESGTGAVIYEESIPVSEELRLAAEYLGTDALQLALTGGEDYELLFTSRRANRTAFCIGEIKDSGLYIISRDGRQRKIAPGGYTHFKTEA